MLSGAALGYVGASPFHTPVLNWVGAGLGVLVVYGWQRWLGRASACAMTHPAPDDEDASTPAESVSSRERRVTRR